MAPPRLAAVLVASSASVHSLSGAVTTLTGAPSELPAALFETRPSRGAAAQQEFLAHLREREAAERAAAFIAPMGASFCCLVTAGSDADADEAFAGTATLTSGGTGGPPNLDGFSEEAGTTAGASDALVEAGPLPPFPPPKLARFAQPGTHACSPFASSAAGGGGGGARWRRRRGGQPQRLQHGAR